MKTRRCILPLVIIAAIAAQTQCYSIGNEIRQKVKEEIPHVIEAIDTSNQNCSYYANQGYKCLPRTNCVNAGSTSFKCPGSLEVCCHHSDVAIVSIERGEINYGPRCGRRNINGIGTRIQNENFQGSTQFGEWPHMCAVLEFDDETYEEELNKYVCGASLIAPGLVLTSAHCVENASKAKLKVRCGEWDTQKKVEPYNHQDRHVETIKIHPLFSSRNLKNDFALLFVDEDFLLAPHVDTICLPDNLSGVNSYQPKDCFATGWGKDTFGNHGEYQVIMKQIQMDIVNRSECEQRLRQTRLGENFILDTSFICAGGEKDKDTCKGDGGGPLVCPLVNNQNDKIYVQAGIIAWGIECGVEGYPGVYANVADGLCFIDWATQCHNRISEYLNIRGCKNWASIEMNSIRSSINEDQNKLESMAKNGIGTIVRLRKLSSKINRAKLMLKDFEEENNSICTGVFVQRDKNKSDTLENDDDISLIGY